LKPTKRVEYRNEGSETEHNFKFNDKRDWTSLAFVSGWSFFPATAWQLSSFSTILPSKCIVADKAVSLWPPEGHLRSHLDCKSPSTQEDVAIAWRGVSVNQPIGRCSREPVVQHLKAGDSSPSSLRSYLLMNLPLRFTWPQSFHGGCFLLLGVEHLTIQI
jgi:hypothetical protein